MWTHKGRGKNELLAMSLRQQNAEKCKYQDSPSFKRSMPISQAVGSNVSIYDGVKPDLNDVVVGYRLTCLASVPEPFTSRSQPML